MRRIPEERLVRVLRSRDREGAGPEALVPHLDLRGPQLDRRRAEQLCDRRSRERNHEEV